MISIYVGNLPYDTTEDQLVDLFKQYGQVHRAALVNDRETHRPRGFGFVEMPERAEAQRAIEALGGIDFNGRPLTVNEARRNTGRNTANLSRSAQRPAGAGPAEVQTHGSAGYAARPKPGAVPPPQPSPPPDGDTDEAGTGGGADDVPGAAAATGYGGRASSYRAKDDDAAHLDDEGDGADDHGDDKNKSAPRDDADTETENNAADPPAAGYRNERGERNPS